MLTRRRLRGTSMVSEVVLLVECPHMQELTYASFDLDGKFLGFGHECPCNDATEILKWYYAVPEFKSIDDVERFLRDGA